MGPTVTRFRNIPPAAQFLLWEMGMTIREQREQDDRRDGLTLVWGATVLASFVLLAVDPRLCAITAAFGAFWVLVVMRRAQADRA